MAGPVLARLWNAPVLLLALASLFWAGNLVIGRAMHTSASPFFLSFWRWSLALALLLPFAWPHLRRDWPVLRRSLPVLMLLALLGIMSFSTLVYLGLRSTPAVNGLLLQSVIPLAILTCSFLLFGERARPRQWLGVLVSIGGVIAIASHGALDDLLHLRLHPGDLWVLAAVLSYALYSACLRLRPRLHPLSFLAASIALSLAALGPAYAIERASLAPSAAFDAALLPVILYLAVFPSLLSYLFFNRGVELIGANRAGLFIHLIPAFGTVMAVVLLGERLHGFHLAGLALIGLGLSLALRR